MKKTEPLRNYRKNILSGYLSSFHVYHNDYRICTLFIPIKSNLKNKTTEEWLYAISQIYTNYGKDRRRFFKKLCQIVQDVEMTEEYILASSFCNIMVDREQVTTEIKDGKELKECAIKDPYDIDYHISPNNIAKVLKDWVTEPSKKEEKNRKEIFSVVTKNSNGKIPPCPHCKGEGVLRCEHCNGSGREQYVDGYYASGEERIKTGNCSHCYGRGNTQCEACGGEGKPQIYSDNYQIINSMEDKHTVMRYDCISGISSTWESSKEVYYPDIYSAIEYVTFKAELRGERLGENEIDAIDAIIARWFLLQEDSDNIFRSNNDNFWCECDDDELEQCIDKLYKNQNEIIIDHNGQSILAMLKEKGQEYTELYQKNKDAAYSKWEEMGLLKGQVGCALEYHELIPVVEIHFTNKINGEKVTIFILKHDNKDWDKEDDDLACIIEGSTELKFWDGLFL
jgi:hemin uptake protein HemP